MTPAMTPLSRAAPTPPRARPIARRRVVPSPSRLIWIMLRCQGWGAKTHLQNERAHSRTAGLAITPKAFPGLGVTADYIKINIANEITATRKPR